VRHLFVCAGLAPAFICLAQSQDMSGMQMNMPGMKSDPTQALLMNQASGTAMNPESFPLPMVMADVDRWKLMFMGQAFLVETQQSGPRGYDKFYGPNWVMGMADHKLGVGTLEFQAMISLDPATITERSYPLLFQTGETAFGKPLVDAQHPHDLFMSIAAQYALAVTENTIVQIYYAPVGDPALGPVAFPHRLSASELPQAPIGHHWQDSTHIADNVVTFAIKYKIFRLEASGFYGSEPDENRWNIDWGPINSWSARASVMPNRNWMAQVSVGRLSNPERESPGDVTRATASLHYTRPMNGSGWATSFIWGRNHETVQRRNLNSYLLESVFPASRKNFLTGRAELVDKDELFADDVTLEESIAKTSGSTFRIGAYTLGYTRDVGTFHHVEVGIGVNATAYTLPPAIKPYYGDHPAGVNVFGRFRLR